MTASIVEPGSLNCVARIEERQSFREHLKFKVPSAGDEGVAQIEQAKKHWQMVQKCQKERPGRFRFVGRLPRLCDVRQCQRDGLVCVRQRDFGLRPHYPLPSGLPLILEAQRETDAVRVYALGDNIPDSCCVYDVTEVNAYRLAMQQALDCAQLPEEVDFWTYLFQDGCIQID